MAFRQPHNGLAVHCTVGIKESLPLINGDNISEQNGLVPLEDIFALVASVDQKGVRVGCGLGSRKGLLAFSSRRNLIWNFNPRLTLIPFDFMLRNIQGLKIYRMAIRHLHSTIQIREANEADLEEVKDRLGLIGSLSPLVTGFVAILNSRIVGYVALVRHPPEDEPYIGYWISGLKIWLPCRGLGLGEALCHKAIDKAKAEGAKELHLLVYPENMAAINLYRNLGFEPTVIPGVEECLEEAFNETGKRETAMSLRLSSK